MPDRDMQDTAFAVLFCLAACAAIVTYSMLIQFCGRVF